MKSRIVIDGNAFYEIDEDCMEQKRLSGMTQGRQPEKQGERRRSQQPDKTD